MVCVVELDTIAIDEADGCMRTEGRDGELFKEISSDLEIRLLLTIRFICLRFSKPCSCNLTAVTTRSRPVVHLLRLPIGFERLIRRPLSRQKKVGNRGSFVDGRGSRLSLREPRWRVRVGVTFLWVLSCSPSITKCCRERRLSTYHSPSTSACTPHRPRRYPSASLPTPGGVVPN